MNKLKQGIHVLVGSRVPTHFLFVWVDSHVGRKSFRRLEHHGVAFAITSYQNLCSFRDVAASPVEKPQIRHRRRTCALRGVLRTCMRCLNENRLVDPKTVILAAPQHSCTPSALSRQGGFSNRSCLNCRSKSFAKYRIVTSKSCLNRQLSNRGVWTYDLTKDYLCLDYKRTREQGGVSIPTFHFKENGVCVSNNHARGNSSCMARAMSSNLNAP